MSTNTPTAPKYPHIKVKLVGEDGNAFNLIGLVTNGLRSGGVSKADREAFIDEAMAGDYDHLLRTCITWVKVT